MGDTNIGALRKLLNRPFVKRAAAAVEEELAESIFEALADR